MIGMIYVGVMISLAVLLYLFAWINVGLYI